MKLRSFLLILISLFLITPKTSFALDLNQEDKQKHMSVSSGLVLGGYTSLRATGTKHSKALIWATLGALGLGLVKEYAIDQKPDTEDLQANLVGASWGVMLPFVIEF